MSRAKLDETLQRVRAELASGEPLSPERRAALEELLDEVEPLIAEENEPGEEHEALPDRLREATEHFEESHPQLTMAVGAVADALARMGI